VSLAGGFTVVVHIHIPQHLWQAGITAAANSRYPLHVLPVLPKSLHSGFGQTQILRSLTKYEDSNQKNVMDVDMFSCMSMVKFYET
jgi:hypothetical protein